MDQFPLILGIIWLAVISPGADFAMVSRVSFIEGPRAGIMAAFGIALACWFHISYAIFGLGMVGQLFPQLLNIIKILGAIYLIYLGLTMVLAKPVPTDDGLPISVSSGGKSFVTGVLTNGLNPKTSIFVISLYTQVIGSSTPLGVQLGYGLAISLSHLVWFVAVAVFLSRPTIRTRVLANQRIANCCIGAILIFLGIALGLTDIS
jgi:threonine/homoserine/homoserine lactone efflux protein